MNSTDLKRASLLARQLDVLNRARERPDRGGQLTYGGVVLPNGILEVYAIGVEIE